MGITEILRRIWLFSANKIKSSESFSKQPTQLIVELNSSLRHIIVTNYLPKVDIVEILPERNLSLCTAMSNMTELSPFEVSLMGAKW